METILGLSKLKHKNMSPISIIEYPPEPALFPIIPHKNPRKGIS